MTRYERIGVRIALISYAHVVRDVVGTLTTTPRHLTLTTYNPETTHQIKKNKNKNKNMLSYHTYCCMHEFNNHDKQSGKKPRAHEKKQHQHGKCRAYGYSRVSKGAVRSAAAAIHPHKHRRFGEKGC